MSDPFYVGYEPRAPRALARWIRTWVLALAFVAAAAAMILVASQQPFAASRFAFGSEQTFEGEFVAWPYPMVVIGSEPHLLVGPGKFGATELVQANEGETVRLRGSLIERKEGRAIQIVPDSLRPQGKRATRTSRVVLGDVRLRGQIVDTKCFLGVMNPGSGKVHHDCAVRCISGGVPPGFLVRDADGDARVLLLTGSDGRAIGREVLDYVAEPILISGVLVRTGSTFVLQAEPRDFVRE